MKPVILGAGLAGLSAALALAPKPVVVVSPRPLGEGCSSAWAQGGIAAAVGEGDSAEFHAQDTMAAGNGINDPAIVRQVTGDGIAVIERLVAQGVAFDRDAQGKLLFGLEAAHGRNRIAHFNDSTGLAIMNALIRKVRTTPSIEVIENARAMNLIIQEGRIVGVHLLKDGKPLTLASGAVVLATGSAAALWRETTNPHENWGSGLALAARAGATLGDLEFVQFHPTAIDIGLDPMPLASEALRGEGGILVNEHGERFVEELQPRDIVTRALWEQILKGHRVFLDTRKALGSEFAKRFPTVHNLCAAAHIDPVKQPIPVRPAAHYHMGGVLTDAEGRTDISGLWACGEVACTGLHGANRLASNSLLEAASFGWRVGTGIKDVPQPTEEHRLPAPAAVGNSDSGAASIRAIMSKEVGVIRDNEGLRRALNVLLPQIHTSDRALVGAMIATSALKRKESRGAHFRSDFPKSSPLAERSTFKLSDLEK